MPNYLTMPKQQQILALLALGWSYRRIEAETGVRRETISRYDRRRANAAKTFPGSDRPPPGDALDAGAPDDVKSGQTVRRLGVKCGQSVPRLGGAPAVQRDGLSRGDYREARHGPERPADLARPGRGVRLRRELRVGEAIRADDRADASGAWASFIAPQGPKRRSISSAAHPHSTPRPGNGVGPGCFA